MLWWTAAAAVPVAVHLLTRTRFRVVRFATIDLLLQSVHQRRRWVRLRDVLLLLLRMG